MVSWRLSDGKQTSLTQLTEHRSNKKLPAIVGLDPTVSSSTLAAVSAAGAVVSGYRWIFTQDAIRIEALYIAIATIIQNCTGKPVEMEENILQFSKLLNLSGNGPFETAIANIESN